MAQVVQRLVPPSIVWQKLARSSLRNDNTLSEVHSGLWPFTLVVRPSEGGGIVRKGLLVAVGILALLAGPLCLAPSAQAQKPIKVAMVNTSTGGAALYGLAGIEGAKIAVAELNAAGGVLGRKVELILRDDGADRKSTRLNSSHSRASRMPSSA